MAIVTSFGSNDICNCYRLVNLNTFIFSVTGHTVKCDVIVDDIHGIEIETTTQELYLHNTPESLIVTAYDEFGNTFSTLEGVPFEWHIHSDTYSGSTDGYDVLRFLTWTESEYATPNAIADLERQGFQVGVTPIVVVIILLFIGLHAIG